MFVTSLLITAYLIVALFALFMTLDEQQQTGDRSPVLKALGFLACLLWPLTLVTVLVATAAIATQSGRLVAKTEG